MFLVSTRNFPPELGGMQNLMEGLSNALIDHGPVKVFADNHEHAENYDQNSKLNIERISGFKIFRKYRKANLVKDFIKQNQIRACFFDHWKSIENIELDTLKKTKSFCLIHSKEINHPVGSSLNKRILKALEKANFVIANSKFTKELGLKLGLKDIHVINPGCNYPIVVSETAKEYSKNYPEDSFDNMIKFAKTNNFGEINYLIDETQEIAKKYGAVCTPDFFGYNKELKLQYRGRFRELKDLKPVSGGDSDLKIAMKMISETQAGPKEQIPSMGCNIKWFN